MPGAWMSGYELVSRTVDWRNVYNSETRGRAEMMGEMSSPTRSVLPPVSLLYSGDAGSLLVTYCCAAIHTMLFSPSSLC